MSHKVHPKSFRMKRIADWDSRGFYGKKIAENLEEDFKIRELLSKKLEDSNIEKIEIERFPEKFTIIINTGRPGLIIGRGGEGVEKIKKLLVSKIFRKNKGKIPEVKIEIKGVRDVWASPNLVVEWIAQRLKRRMPHRKVVKQALDKIMSVKGVKGGRIEVSGRLGGAEIARREWHLKGNLPRQTIRADIEYGAGFARCSYGSIGIKVWVYKGEKFD
jgi:small subunit ribosomal protein S3